MTEKKKKNKFQIVINFICTIIIILLVILVVLMFIGKMQNKPMFILGRSAVWVVSPSMKGEFDENTFILVREINSNDIKIGDVIMFKSDDPSLNGGYNTHRVVSIVGNNEEFVMQGDNHASNPGPDLYNARAENVVAIYEKTLPTLTSMMRFFLTDYGFFTVIMALLVLTSLTCMPDIIMYFKNKKH